MKHGRITRYTESADGTVHIRKEGYGEYLNSVTEEIRETFITTSDTFADDLARALTILNEIKTPNVQYEIAFDKDSKPNRIVRTYVVRKTRVS